jgi:hypothetical protein
MLGAYRIYIRESIKEQNREEIVTGGMHFGLTREAKVGRLNILGAE